MSNRLKLINVFQVDAKVAFDPENFFNRAESKYFYLQPQFNRK